MRALIRGTEICLENAWTKWQRMNMLFLTGKEKDADGNPLPGDGWTLVEDDQEPAEDTEEPQTVQTTSMEEKPAEQGAEALPETRSSESEGAVTEPPSTVTYGGKEYTLDELKKLIG